MVIDILEKQKETYNNVVNHPLQSYEWGEFREKTGLSVVRKGFETNGKIISGFQLTIHKIPHTPFTIGYLPKGDMPTKDLLDELKKIGKKYNCIFIQLEPNVIEKQEARSMNQEEIGTFKSMIHDSRFMIQTATHPLFTKYSFILNLSKTEEELLKGMHPKARYNIRVAQRHGVEVVEDNSQKAFETYWHLMEETTKRQKFYAHTKNYHQLQFETFRALKNEGKTSNLSSHLFLAKYQEKILTAWMLFVFKDTLYYPYGASSSEHREVMHSSLIMWEAIRFGKKLGLSQFDLWGAMEENPNPKDPWFGFHDFKRKFGPTHVTFIGSYDLVINPLLYQAYKISDKIRWMLLKAKAH